MESVLASATEPSGAGVHIVPLAPAHEAGWRSLWRGFAGALETPLTDEAVATTWGWLGDPHHPLEGIIAVEAGGRPVGLAHFYGMTKPLRGLEGGYLADLFVEPPLRGQGIGGALFAAVADIGRSRGWSHLRWVTPDNNHDAIALYDRIARRVPVIAYDLTL